MLLNIFFAELKYINYKKKEKIYKPLFKTFQHRAKLSLSVKKCKKSDVSKTKFVNP